MTGSTFLSEAARIFGSDSDGVNWPYGLGDPDWRLKRNDPGNFERRSAEQRARQSAIVHWAQTHGLKASRNGCCPNWLLRGSSRRCSRRTPCGLYGSNPSDRAWLDHPVHWLKDGKPAVITSAPYSYTAADQQRVAWWLGQNPQLAAATGATGARNSPVAAETPTELRSSPPATGATGFGWYGYGTTQILLWRTDRIQDVEPAPTPWPHSDEPDGATA